MKEHVARMVGKLTEDGKEIPGAWEVYVYFRPESEPLSEGSRRIGYIIGSASRIK